MSVAACLLIVLGVTLLTIVASLLIPVSRPEPHPFVTDPFELADEREGRHRMPEMDEGPTRRLGDSLIRPPL